MESETASSQGSTQVTLNQSEARAASRIHGLGVYRPEIVVTNDDVCQWIDSSDEWIRQRTGIVTRIRAPRDIGVTDMAEFAARDAMDAAGVKPEQIGAVLVSTVTHPYATPSAASQLADRLGITPAPAYDISAACAGYCYGIAQADALVRSGAAEYVLVIGVEKLSDFIDNHERTISFLLGDAAGAAIVGPAETPGISKSVWGSDGSKWETISMTRSMLDVRDYSESLRQASDRNELALVEETALWPTLKQDGPSVFRWVVWEMAKVAKKALDDAGIQAEDLAAFVPHQANMRIIDSLAKELKLPEHVVIARDIQETGNTSAASIPLATHRLLQENPELHGKLSLQIGFGAGLVYGAQVVVLP